MRDRIRHLTDTKEVDAFEEPGMGVESIDDVSDDAEWWDEHSTIQMATSSALGAHVAERPVNRRSPLRVLAGYGPAWVTFVILAALIALICNGLYGIPLFQVVDVTLALFLSWVALIVSAYVIVFIMEVANFQFSDAVESFLLIAAFTFLPFGAITGYMIYGWLGGGPVSDASFVYEGFIGIFVQGYTYVTTVAGDILGAVEIKEVQGGGTVSSVNPEVLLKWAQVIAVSLAALDVLKRWFWPTPTYAYS